MRGALLLPFTKSLIDSNRKSNIFGNSVFFKCRFQIEPQRDFVRLLGFNNCLRIFNSLLVASTVYPLLTYEVKRCLFCKQYLFIGPKFLSNIQTFFFNFKLKTADIKNSHFLQKILEPVVPYFIEDNFQNFQFLKETLFIFEIFFSTRKFNLRYFHTFHEN